MDPMLKAWERRLHYHAHSVTPAGGELPALQQLPEWCSPQPQMSPASPWQATRQIPVGAEESLVQVQLALHGLQMEPSNHICTWL